MDASHSAKPVKAKWPVAAMFDDDNVSTRMKIFGDVRSGNCLKVKYTANHLGLAYTWKAVDIMQGESRSADFLARNWQGQVPVVEFEDGRTLAQSNAIIRYLARGSALLPDDAYAQAKVDEMLFWEQYSHEPYVAVCRFQMLYLGRAAAERDAWRVERGELALDAMDSLLGTQPWMAGDRLSIADIALIAYTRLAHEGGFDLAGRPQVRQWISRTERALGIADAI